MDARWEFLLYAALGLPGDGSLCHACSPGIFVVMAWRDGRSVEACRDHGRYYEPRLAAVTKRLKQEGDFDYYLGGTIELFGTLVQIGRQQEAVATVERLLTSGPFALEFRQEGAAVLAHLKKRLAASAATMDRACALQGFEFGG